jgi:outer membrane protein OmpA-like peptidoglycan-associated protein
MHKLSIVVLTVVGIASSVGFASQAPSASAQALTLYNAAVREASGAGQIALFRQSLQALETFEGSVGLADALLRGGGDPKEARRLCERAFTALASPSGTAGQRNQATALVCLARTYRATGESNLAASVLKRSIELERTPLAEQELREVTQPRFKSAEAIVTELDQGVASVVGSAAVPRGAVPVEVSADIYVNFDFDRATLTVDGERQVGEIARAFNLVGRKSATSVKFKVIGHTDARGTEEYNLGLSRRRATTVADVLVRRYGVNMDVLTVEGHGMHEPLLSGNTEETFARNRRVELQLVR